MAQTCCNDMVTTRSGQYLSYFMAAISVTTEQPIVFDAVYVTLGCTVFLNASRLSFNYRAMHFSAKRGIAIACRLSVCLSVCL